MDSAEEEGACAAEEVGAVSFAILPICRAAAGRQDRQIAAVRRKRRKNSTLPREKHNAPLFWQYITDLHFGGLVPLKANKRLVGVLHEGTDPPNARLQGTLARLLMPILRADQACLRTWISGGWLFVSVTAGIYLRRRKAEQVLHSKNPVLLGSKEHLPSRPSVTSTGNPVVILLTALLLATKETLTGDASSLLARWQLQDPPHSWIPQEPSQANLWASIPLLEGRYLTLLSTSRGLPHSVPYAHQAGPPARSDCRWCWRQSFLHFL